MCRLTNWLCHLTSRSSWRKGPSTIWHARNNQLLLDRTYLARTGFRRCGTSSPQLSSGPLGRQSNRGVNSHEQNIETNTLLVSASFKHSLRSFYLHLCSWCIQWRIRLLENLACTHNSSYSQHYYPTFLDHCLAMGIDWRYCIPYSCNILYCHGLAEISFICLFRNSWTNGNHKYFILCQLEVQSWGANKVVGGLTSRSSWRNQPSAFRRARKNF